jgi:hypothetical protein
LLARAGRGAVAGGGVGRSLLPRLLH